MAITLIDLPPGRIVAV